MLTQKILMCAPDFFGIDYVINPWMEGNRGNADRILAMQQWFRLKQRIEAHAEILLIPPQLGFPDQVFTANAGMVMGNKVVVSRFHAPERQGEEPFFNAWFAANGFQIVSWPRDIFFEGAGDALFDRAQPIIWAGHGFRSVLKAAPLLESVFNRRVVPLKLVDPRFYHLDTCLCPLEDGYLLYFPPAFDDESQQAIIAHVPEEKRIAVDVEDAEQFACNAVDLKKHVYMNGATNALQDRLKKAGFAPFVTPLSEFMKAGGAAKCLTLKLVE